MDSQTQNPTELPADIDPTAVSIIADEDIHRPLGTGFYFLQPRFFVTAKHVVVEETTGCPRRNLVLMQNGPNYPRATIAFLHPSLDVAVLRIDRPGCTVPLFPSDQRIVGKHGLRYWGYAPSRVTRSITDTSSQPWTSPHTNRKHLESATMVSNGCCDSTAIFQSPDIQAGPVLAAGGGVIAIITQGHTGWCRATEIRGLMPYVTMEFSGNAR